MTTSRIGLLALSALLASAVASAALAAEGYAARGNASWYGGVFHGRKTANGEIFDKDGYTAAHRSLPFGTVLLVTLESTGKRVVVRVNDRGPFVEERIIDLSEAAAREIGLVGAGVGWVSLEEAAGLPLGPIGGIAARAGTAARVGAAGPSPAPSAPAGPAESWCDIQVASFSKKGNAENAAARLRAAGYLPLIRVVSGYHRVILEKLPADRAETERKRLDDLGFPRVMVTLRKIAKGD